MESGPDYLAIGHVCQDVNFPQAASHSPAWGGTVTFAARTARALGLRAAVLTSAASSWNPAQALPGIEAHCLPSACTTTFENHYSDGARRQFIRAVAGRLAPGDVPAGWRRASIVHLGPVAQEVDPALAACFPGAFVGVTPQGWLRAWDEQGRVRPSTWNDARDWLPRLDALVLSLEDVNGDEDLAAEWAARTRLLVVTRGARGATLYVRGQPAHFPAPSVQEVEPTGAGDIFAAAFFVRLRETGEPYAAARFAVCLASASVTRRGLESIPTAAEIEHCKRAA